jgi:ATP-dependent RNA helicase DeaD
LKPFTELGLSKELLQAIHQMGYEEATDIQAETIPLTLAKRDLLGQAQTGTGKTAAFGIPLIEQISMEEENIQALVIAPTRELAVQVAEELNRIGQFKRVRAVPIYGGQDIDRQIRALKKRPQIIVGTPGRLQDHLRRKTIRLQGIQMVVLDEADEMLNMGFIEDIEAILALVPSERQTLLFSATMPDQIRKLASRFMKDPVQVKVKSKEVTMPNIEQTFIELAPQQKFDVLCNLLDIQAPELAIIFGRTKKRVDELTEALNKRGYTAEGLHGDLNQARRDTVIRRFREGTIDIMVATDVAARGLDITGVTHVYNFDIPQEPESYVHRIGRTGRAGKTGVAITFVSYREMDHLRYIERMTKKKIKRETIPTIDEAFEGQQLVAVENLRKIVEEKNYSTYRELAKGLLEEHDSVALVAAALKMITKEPNKTKVSLTDLNTPGRLRTSSKGKTERQTFPKKQSKSKTPFSSASKPQKNRFFDKKKRSKNR